MPWVKLDDHFPDHPKIVAAGPAAAWMHVVALCYCNRMLTDGFIADNQVQRLIAGSHIAETATELAETLCEVGVWHKAKRGVFVGYDIHDFLRYQPSRDQILKEREQNKIRQSKHRNGVTNGSVTPAPVPVPVPVSDPNNQLTSKSLASSLRGTNGNGNHSSEKKTHPHTEVIVRRLERERQQRRRAPRIR